MYIKKFSIRGNEVQLAKFIVWKALATTPRSVVWLVCPPYPTDVEARATQLAWDLQEASTGRGLAMKGGTASDITSE